MSVSRHPRLAALGLFLLSALLLSACNFPGLRATPDAFATAAAETVAVQLTQAAAQIPSLPPATETPPAASATPEPTATEPGPSPTPGAAGCTDKATFVSDVTIPDNSILAPGETFTKTWRIRNSGTCTWNANYSLVFESGNIMNGAASVPLPGQVPPNTTVDVSVDLEAPITDGSYKGNWMFKNQAGVLFGIGASANTPFFVLIVVGPTPTPKPAVAYSFAANYCDADWSSGAGALSCPGTDTDNTGFVIRLANPRLENGEVENEQGLWTHPEWVNDGVISGKFPAFTVQAGDRFQTVLACRFNGPACNVRFQLKYEADGGPLTTLGEWTETYDGSIQKLNLDLSSLAGSSVEFTLSVVANGSSSQDWAIWLLPRIVR